MLTLCLHAMPTKRGGSMNPHLRALAESTTTARLKARLLKDAEQHEGLAALADEEAIGAPVG